jgi:hypothetical protein
MLKFSFIASLILGTALPSPASAAIIQTFASRQAFVAASGHAIGLPLGLPGASPVFADSLVTGSIRLSARDGLLAGDGGGIVSTAFDSDELILDFNQPIFAIGLFGGIGDAAFGYIDGVLGIDAVGSGVAEFAAGAHPTYFGLISDTGFSQLRLSVRDFDEGASSVAFAALQDRIDLASAVPEPTSWLLLIAGFGLVGAQHRRRRLASVRLAYGAA